jgi:bifunctional UDP-N-acetylglucosamine pyrophosphorylase/glucosamine-1-phosphate N-acetyltransferase
MKAIIMAAGKGTRTYPLTLTRPKPLLPILQQTIIENIFDTLLKVGITETILIVHYMKDKIEQKLGNQYKEMKITYVDQKEAKGTGHAPLMARKYITEDDVLIMNGDDLHSEEELRNVLKKCPSISVREVKTPQLYGIFEYEEKDGEMIATELEEKPEKPKSSLANIGIYYVGKDFFEYLDRLEISPRGELEITDAIKAYMKKKDVRLVKAEPYWLPIGHPWDLLTATEALIGKGVIGKNVKIGEGTIIENSLIFGDVEIGKNCKIRNSIIGFNVKIGDNFETLDAADEIYSRLNGKTIKVNREKFGVTIGDNVIVEDNVTTYPGVKIWPGVIVKKDVKEDLRE